MPRIWNLNHSVFQILMKALHIQLYEQRPLATEVCTLCTDITEGMCAVSGVIQFNTTPCFHVVECECSWHQNKAAVQQGQRIKIYSEGIKSVWMMSQYHSSRGEKTRCVKVSLLNKYAFPKEKYVKLQSFLFIISSQIWTRLPRVKHTTDYFFNLLSAFEMNWQAVIYLRLIKM